LTEGSSLNNKDLQSCHSYC